MNNKNVICVFSKCPKPGQVKTRLEETLGKKHAAYLARAFLMDTISSSLRIDDASWVVAHWPPESRKEFEEILFLLNREEPDRDVKRKTAEVNLMPQRGTDLGERLANAFADFFSQGAEKVLTVGSDSPQLEPLIYRAAFELLNQNDVVLGPTFDGGYYLVGMNKPYCDIFSGIEWSGPLVYKQTTDILDENRIKWQELEISYDIDTSDDLEQLYFEIDNLRLTGEDAICYHTERCLKSLTK